eukprot:g2207.t1
MAGKGKAPAATAKAKAPAAATTKAKAKAKAGKPPMVPKAGGASKSGSAPGVAAAKETLSRIQGAAAEALKKAQQDPRQISLIFNSVDSENANKQRLKRARETETAELTKELAMIKQQERWLQKEYQPLCKRLEQRKKERARLQKVLADAKAQTKQLAKFSANKKQTTSVTQRNTERSACTAKLEAERGFKTAAGTTNTGPHKPPSLRPQRSRRPGGRGGRRIVNKKSAPGGATSSTAAAASGAKKQQVW